MRFILTLDQAIAAAGLGFALAIGWTAGCWLASKLLSFIKL